MVALQLESLARDFISSFEGLWVITNQFVMVRGWFLTSTKGNHQVLTRL